RVGRTYDAGRSGYKRVLHAGAFDIAEAGVVRRSRDTRRLQGFRGHFRISPGRRVDQRSPAADELREQVVFLRLAGNGAHPEMDVGRATPGYDARGIGQTEGVDDVAPTLGRRRRGKRRSRRTARRAAAPGPPLGGPPQTTVVRPEVVAPL